MKASSSRLDVGETSIDRVTPYRQGDAWVICWRIRISEHEPPKTKYSQGRTKGEARRRAHATAKKMLARSAAGAWGPDTPIDTYMEKVTWPLITADRLGDASIAAYTRGYNYLLGDCGKKGCTHAHRFAGRSIAAAMRPRSIKQNLEEIAELHGAGGAKNATTVLSRYVADPMVIDELLDINPVKGLSIDTSHAPALRKQRGGRSLTLDQYRAVKAWLLAQDPADVPKAKPRSPWPHSVRVTERAALLDILLIQMTTGLRTSELCRRPARDVEITNDGTAIFHLPAGQTKTGHGRPVPCVDPRVSARIADRISKVDDPDRPLIPTPTDPTKPWERRNRDKKLEALYLEIGRELDIELFTVERGHMWRTTINTLTATSLPEDARVRWLGHTTDVNRRHYTAVTTTEDLVTGAQVLMEPHAEPCGKPCANSMTQREESGIDGQVIPLRSPA